MVVDVSADGTLLDKSYNKAYEILERIGTRRRVAGALELDAITSLIAHVSSLTNMIKTLERATVMQEMKEAELTCVYCGEDHVFDECPSDPASVYYMGNFNRNDNHISIHTIQDGNNILILVGVIKEWETQ
ncbi:hypothetical protein EPI10_005725 [Gossypium australe]|uniref:Uncharacterized protein n=1 Tax=Gossypium australe TaxID=47621 RepID=A0A5B6WQT0_9ROSI|nr:hypothetical protein EPI10_005725 [Gossypium australe]